jgi:carbon monoxide dehydrogenase subunit G
MIVTGEITLPAPREIVFQVLQDAPFFASCVEGVRDLKEIDATHYDAVLDTKVAYMKFTFKVSVQVTRLTAPARIEAKIEGTPLGIVGRFTAVSTTDLIDVGSDTLVRYAIDANLTGKLGSMGQPVLKAKAKEMERKFAEKMRAAFAGVPPTSAFPLVREGQGGGACPQGTVLPHSSTPTAEGGEQNGSGADR